MCLRPLTIKSYRDIHGNGTGYMLVPCGVCEQCLRNKQNYLIQRVRLMSTNHYCYMVTLTYDDKHLPFFEYNNQLFTYVNISHFQNMVKRMRKYLSFSFSYLCVTERGKLKHRPHIHALFFVKYSQYSLIEHYNIGSDLQKSILDNWSVNIGTNRKPIFEPLFTFVIKNGRSNFDFHPVTMVNGDMSDAFFYATKYVTKYDSFTDNIRKFFFATMSPEDYRKFWNLWKPRLLLSKRFGSDESYRKTIENMLHLSKIKKHPCYFNPDGSSFPLSPYLYNKFGNLELKAFFSQYTPTLEDEHNQRLEYENKLSKHRNTLKFMSEKY